MHAVIVRGFLGVLICALAVGCYYSPEIRKEKADPSFMSEEEAESLVQKKLAPYGIKFVYNMKLKRDDAEFVADGYDRDLRIGYEYRSHQGMDFEGEEDQSPKGLTEAEIDFLFSRQKEFREYFLIIPEGPKEDVVGAIDKFVEDLYAWEVLKKAKPKNKDKDALFPDAKKDKDALPWEATGDLKKKRKEMEANDALDAKPGEEGSGDTPMDGWGSVDSSGPDSDKKDDEDWGGSDSSEDDGEWGSEDDTKKKEDSEEEEEEDF